MERWLEERRVDPTGLSWDDFIGSEPAKREIRSLLARLVHRDELEAAGMAIPKGVLVHGEPGSGKTYLTRVMAAELLRAVSDVAFYELNAAELESVDRLETVIAALRTRPGMVIVALDEADLFGLDRWSRNQSHETRSILLAFLSAVDGLRAVGNVFWVLTANSELSDFDPAVVRPGRIELGIPLGRPARSDRRSLFDYYATKVPCSPGLNLEAATELLGSATPAKVRGVMADAYALALSSGELHVTNESLVDAIRRDGIAYDAISNERETRVRAIHEAGHAIVATVLGQSPTLVVIDRHGAARTSREEDEAGSATRTWAEVRGRLITSFAGIESERLIRGEDAATLGSSQDVDDAATEARDAIAAALVPAVLPLPSYTLAGDYAEDYLAGRVEELFRDLIPVATQLVAEHREAIERFALVLARERHLAGTALRDALNRALAGTT